MQDKIKGYIEQAFVIITALASILGVNHVWDIPGIESETLVGLQAAVALYAAIRSVWEMVKQGYAKLQDES